MQTIFYLKFIASEFRWVLLITEFKCFTFNVVRSVKGNIFGINVKYFIPQDYHHAADD